MGLSSLVLMAGAGFLTVIELAILRTAHSVTDLNISGQYGPNHGAGGDSHDQIPPEHPHDDLGYQTWLGRAWRAASTQAISMTSGLRFRRAIAEVIG